MLKVTPQYVTNEAGEKVSVILPIEEYAAIVEQIEDWEDEMLAKKAIEEDDGERVPMEEAFKRIDKMRSENGL